VSAVFATDMPTGWIHYDAMTDEQKRAHVESVSAMPKFSLYGDTPPVGTKVLLTASWSHEITVKAIGQAFLGWFQDTGSCVGVGGGTAQQTLNCFESIFKQDPDKIVLQWWGYNYGMSRKRAGMNGRGEGSFGSTFAKSMAEDGTVDMLHEGLDEIPKVQIRNGMFSIGQQNELIWSDGNKASAQLRAAAKPHVFHNSPLSTGTQVRESILNGYPVTRAGMVFANPGSASVSNGALVGRYNGRGGHQESWLGYWNHPQLGELIWEQNQWGANAYGSDPGGGPAGGCWIRMNEIESFCADRNAEVYSVSGYDGYVDKRDDVLDWARDINPFLS